MSSILLLKSFKYIRCVSLRGGLHFHPDTELELNVSVDYYQECKDGLGAKFAYEVHTLRGTQKNNPKNFRVSNCLAKTRWGYKKMFNK